MKHYVQYHNTAKQGPLELDNATFSIFATKPIKHLIGNRVWLISGEGNTSPKSYFLRYTFGVEAVEEGPKNIARGTKGQAFVPPIQLSGMSWFKDFLSAQQNFSLGVREIPDEFLERFSALQNGR